MAGNQFKTIVRNSVFVGIPALGRSEENKGLFLPRKKKQEKFKKKVFCGAKESYCLYKKAWLTGVQRGEFFFIYLF